MSDAAIVASFFIVILGVWCTIEFILTHKAFKKREQQYHSIAKRVKAGEKVMPHELHGLSHQDRLSITLMMR